MRLLALAGDVQALIAEIRLVAPLRQWCSAHGASLQLRDFHACRRADLAAADVLVVQRGAAPGVLRLQQAMRQRGGAVVYEIDDLLTEIAPHISNRDDVQARLPHLRACLVACDAVSVSTARLGAMLRETVPGLPPVVVVPNQAPPPRDTPLPAQRPGPVTLLFASTENVDTAIVLPAVQALQRQHGDALRIVVVGPPGAAFEAAGIPVRREPVRPRADFLALAAGLTHPVAVIPLEATRFAAGKSAIKWFDYAELGVPTLASAVPPYADVIDHGGTGWLVPNTVPDWTTALQQVLDDVPGRLRVAQAARAAVRDRHGLARTLAGWDEVIAAARGHRAAQSLPPAGTVDRLVGWGDDALSRLRALNRARLARRASRKVG